MDGKAIIDETREALRSRNGELVAAYLFGSVARGTATARSDVDLALLYKELPEPGLSGLGFDVAFELEQRIRRSVDVVVLNRCSADLVHRVLRDGVLVLETDRRARVAFEVRARAEYFDLAPLRKLYRQRPAPTGASPADNASERGDR